MNKHLLRKLNEIRARYDTRIEKRIYTFEEDWDDSLHPRDKEGRFTNKGRITKPLVNGPKETKGYVKEYFSKHPELKSKVKKYLDVLSNVKNFKENHPNIEDGTYDAVTEEPIDTNNLNGLCVTFHQNMSLDEPYGAYSDEDYAAMCVIAMNELGIDNVYIGNYGNPEVSFACDDQKKAVDFAIAHNQESIYDPSEGKAIKNAYYIPEYNPVKEE